MLHTAVVRTYVLRAATHAAGSAKLSRNHLLAPRLGPSVRSLRQAPHMHQYSRSLLALLHICLPPCSPISLVLLSRSSSQEASEAVSRTGGEIETCEIWAGTAIGFSGKGPSKESESNWQTRPKPMCIFRARASRVRVGSDSRGHSRSGGGPHVSSESKAREEITQ